MTPSEVEDVRVVFVTVPDATVGAELARALVDGRLAACVNLVPGLRSIYRWEGVVHDDAEVLLLIKTRSDRIDSLAARVRELHPYDVPEVLVLPVAGGSLPYLEWVHSESGP